MKIEKNDKISKKRSFNGVFDLADEVLEEVFKKVNEELGFTKSVLTNENLIEWGVEGKDLEFFRKLNELKEIALNLDDVAQNNKKLEELKNNKNELEKFKNNKTN